VCYNLKGDSLNTVKSYDKLTKIAPDSLETWLRFGNFYLVHSDSKTAIQYIEKAYEIDNNNPDIIASLSQAYDFAGEQDKAIVLYNKAIKLNPDERAFPFNLGLLYYKKSMQKDIDEAQKEEALKKCVENFNLVVNMNPDSNEDYYRQAYEILSSAQIQLKQFDDAKTTLLQALDLFPDAANLYYYLGVVYSRLNDKDKAKEAFDKSEKLGN
jgi:tetratricopeptide (TPR) repeat protein